VGRGSAGSVLFRRIVALFLSLAALAGCSSRTVHVEDARGIPLAGATVSAVALSVEGLPKTTDARGDAALPADIEGARWVTISKPGFKTVYILVPDAWPLEVTLLSQGESVAE
jgi:hypothetical protein